LGPMGCTEMSVMNFHFTQCNIPKECSRSLKSSRVLGYFGVVKRPGKEDDHRFQV